MQEKKELTQARLKEILHYDEDTGIFTWKIDRLSGAIKAGAIAGRKTTKDSSYIGIGNKLYTSARLAWLYIYGEWPSEPVIRIDRNKNNNAKNNLKLRVRRTDEEREKRVEKEKRKLFNVAKWGF